jgi:hypothetical protein
MRLRQWAMLAFLSGLLSGCAQTPTNGNYCDLASPLVDRQHADHRQPDASGS